MPAGAGRGDADETYRQACAIGDPAGIGGPCPPARWVAFDLVEAAVSTGRATPARRQARWMQQVEPGETSPRWAMVRLAAEALVTDDDSWPAGFEAALAVPDARAYPFDRARIQFAFGGRLRRNRHPAQARQQLRDAQDVFTRLGARDWVDRASAELRATGATHPVPAGTGGGVLTGQERMVAELAAAGLSNKEIGRRLFMSPRTVSGHLYRLFPKLGVVRRAALRDALVGLD